MAKGARARRKAERPGEILEAAFEEFAQRGFAATRLEDIAERAGVTRGAVYFYFENKEEVFVAMVRELSRPLHAEIEVFLADRPGPAPEMLRSYLRFVYQIAVDDQRSRELLRLLIAEANWFPEMLDEQFRMVWGPFVDTFQKVLQEGAIQGELRAAPVQEFPEQIVGPALLFNIWILLFGERKPLDPERHFEAAIDLILHGLLPRKN